MRSGFLSLLLLLLLPPAVPAADGAGPVRRDNLSAQLIADQQTVAPGGRLGAALRLVHDAHWHTYWLNPGDSGLDTRLSWSLPPGASAGAIRWPAPQRLPVGPLVNFGYSDELLLPVQLQLPRDLQTTGRFELSLKASWLVCKEECIPGEATFTLSLPVAQQAVPDPHWSARIDAAFAAEPPLRDGAAELAREGDDIVVRFDPAGALRDLQSLEMFPLQTQVLANARGSVRQLPNGRIEIRTPVSDAFNGMPERLEFLLVDGTAASRNAVRMVAATAIAPAPVAQRSAQSMAGLASTGDPAPLGILVALLFALLGGMALNLMPCVFPVLSLKAIGLARNVDDRARSRQHGLLYLAGVLASFAVLAAALLGLRASGEQLGWGFQLQLPWVVASLALLMLALGLSLSGLFQIGGAWMGAGQSLASGHDGRSAFFTGVLAVLVATPCTAPLMGPALGFAVTQPAFAAMAVFLALGLGLALPIVLLSFVPALAHRLPRPGAWMEVFKQAMAFPLYLTAVWLLWVLGRQAGADAIAQVLVGAVALAFALWLLGRPGGWWSRAMVVLGFAATVSSVAWLAAPGAAEQPAGRPDAGAGAAWEPWSPKRLESLRAAGRPVLVNMTAAWCITCLANERLALSSDAFRAALRQHGIVYLKGDWTNRDARITVYLAQFGRNGVPVYALYPSGGGEPELLPQLLTPGLVDAALTRATAR